MGKKQTILPGRQHLEAITRNEQTMVTIYASQSNMPMMRIDSANELNTNHYHRPKLELSFQVSHAKDEHMKEKNSE